MDRTKVVISILAVLLIALFLYWIVALRTPVPNYSLINNFSRCSSAGFPVSTTTPRRCFLPNGEMYVEQLAVAQQCTADSQCSNGQLCVGGQCQDFVLQTSCKIDSDCKLINKDLDYGCCWAGVCQPVDYSQDNWVPVNRQQFESVRSQACQTQVCGPRPACSANLVNDSYEARCVGGECVKLPVRN